jgi:DNA-binding transcriptional regulator YiaG
MATTRCELAANELAKSLQRPEWFHTPRIRNDIESITTICQDSSVKSHREFASAMKKLTPNLYLSPTIGIETIEPIKTSIEKSFKKHIATTSEDIRNWNTRMDNTFWDTQRSDKHCVLVAHELAAELQKTKFISSPIEIVRTLSYVYRACKESDLHERRLFADQMNTIQNDIMKNIDKYKPDGKEHCQKVGINTFRSIENLLQTTFAISVNPSPETIHLWNNL